MEASEITRRAIGEAGRLDREARELVAAKGYKDGQIISGMQGRGSTVVTGADIEQARREDQR